MPVFAVNRDEELRFGELHHEPQFLTAGVAGNVNVRHAVIDHLRAFLIKLVDHAGHTDLVARNRGGGDDDRVAFADVQAVRRRRHAKQPAHGLALAAGGDYADLVVAIALGWSTFTMLFPAES